MKQPPTTAAAAAANAAAKICYAATIADVAAPSPETRAALTLALAAYRAARLAWQDEILEADYRTASPQI